MTAIEILGKIVLAVIVIIGVIAYVQYRQELNKKEHEARFEKREFKKPTVVDDSKAGLTWVIVIIVGSIVFLGVYKVLHFLYPGLFPD